MNLTRTACLVIATCLLPAAASAGIIMFMDDPQGEGAVVGSVQDDPKVRGLWVEFSALNNRMLRWKERDFKALFGAPILPRAKDFALTCTQPRMFMTGGVGLFGDENDKSHTDSYRIGDALRVDVRFQSDGMTPMYMHFFLPVGNEFIRLDRADRLEGRVAWERLALWKATEHIENRWKEIVGWEVDRAEADKLYSGLESPAPAEKLRATLAWGEKQGFQLERWANHWKWYRGDVLMAEAYEGTGHNQPGETPTHFLLYRADRSRIRDQMGDPRGHQIRWSKPDGSTYRAETWVQDDERKPWRTVAWGWSAPEGRGIRSETDTNGDGVPDEVWTPTGGTTGKVEPLTVERSWAVHPELIPADLRIPDQPDRRLPVQRIMK